MPITTKQLLEIARTANDVEETLAEAVQDGRLKLVVSEDYALFITESLCELCKALKPWRENGRKK